MSKKYYSQDITFCMNTKCRIKSCPRNPIHVNDKRLYYSCADLEGTDCYKKKVKGGKVRNGQETN